MKSTAPFGWRRRIGLASMIVAVPLALPVAPVASADSGPFRVVAGGVTHTDGGITHEDGGAVPVRW